MDSTPAMSIPRRSNVRRNSGFAVTSPNESALEGEFASFTGPVKE